MAGFLRECVAAIPAAVRDRSHLWVRVDSAGFQHDVFAAAEALGAVFSGHRPPTRQRPRRASTLAADPATVWRSGARRRARQGVRDRRDHPRRRRRPPPLRPAAGCAPDRAPSTHPRRRPAVARRSRRLAVPRHRHQPARPVRPAATWSKPTTAHAAASPKTPSASSKTTSGSTTPRCRTSSGTGCGGTPAPWPTTSPAGSETLALPARVPPLPRQTTPPRVLQRRRPRRHATPANSGSALPRNHTWADAFIEALTRIRGSPAFAWPSGGPRR